MRLTLSILIVVIGILFLVSLMIFGCTQQNNFAENLAEIESIEVFNKTPSEDRDSTVQRNIEVLGSKAFKKYNRKLITNDYINSSLYKKKHPDDALLITEFHSDGSRKVYVFTNKPPDSTFFRLE